MLKSALISICFVLLILITASCYSSSKNVKNNAVLPAENTKPQAVLANKLWRNFSLRDESGKKIEDDFLIKNIAKELAELSDFFLPFDEVDQAIVEFKNALVNKDNQKFYFSGELLMFKLGVMVNPDSVSIPEKFVQDHRFSAGAMRVYNGERDFYSDFKCNFFTYNEVHNEWKLLKLPNANATDENSP